MRFLADENVPQGFVNALREKGHDVEWVRTAAPGVPDEAVLAAAVRDVRILLTFDKDFGALAAGSRNSCECGVVLLRVPLRPGLESVASIAAAIDARTDWIGHFSTIEPGRIRMRLLAAT